MWLRWWLWLRLLVVLADEGAGGALYMQRGIHGGECNIKADRLIYRLNIKV